MSKAYAMGKHDGKNIGSPNDKWVEVLLSSDPIFYFMSECSELTDAPTDQYYTVLPIHIMYPQQSMVPMNNYV